MWLNNEVKDESVKTEDEVAPNDNKEDVKEDESTPPTPSTSKSPVDDAENLKTSEDLAFEVEMEELKSIQNRKWKSDTQKVIKRIFIEFTSETPPYICEGFVGSSFKLGRKKKKLYRELEVCKH